MPTIPPALGLTGFTNGALVSESAQAKTNPALKSNSRGFLGPAALISNGGTCLQHIDDAAKNQSHKVPIAREVLTLEAGGALPENMVHDIGCLGLSFHPDEDYLTQLKKTGADATVLTAVNGPEVIAAAGDGKPDKELLRQLSSRPGAGVETWKSTRNACFPKGLKTIVRPRQLGYSPGMKNPA
jgi:hypothetical protein